MGECSPNGPVTGALPDAPPPAWCMDLPQGGSTALRGDNTWVDAFHPQPHSALATDYRVFDAPLRDGNVFRSMHFAHNDHWMVDVATHATAPGQYEGDPRDLEQALNWGGAVMRPLAAFHARDGKLAVEVDVSASMAAYGDDAWPEIIVTTADRPTGTNVDRFHALGVFGGAPAVGCQLYPDRLPLCTALDASGRSFDRGGQLFKIAATETNAAWRTCGLETPDDQCRDRFRLDLAPRALQLAVNGMPYLGSSDLPLPDALFTSPVYVYFGSWIYLGEPGIARFHWGRIAINP